MVERSRDRVHGRRGSNLLINRWGDFPAGFVGTASGDTMAFTHYMHTLTCHLKND